MKENENIREVIKNVLYNSYAQAIYRIFATDFCILKSFLLAFVLASSSLA